MHNYLVFHRYLLHYLKSLKDWMSPEVWAKYPVAKVSWSLLQVLYYTNLIWHHQLYMIYMRISQDLYHDPRVLEPDPSLTAIACIHLALETFGIQVQIFNPVFEIEKRCFLATGSFSDNLIN